MDYENKYNEALSRARKELNACGSQDCDAARQMFRLFPELAEPKDERIRNGLIALLKFGLGDGSAIAPGFNETKEQALAWLEKQKSVEEIVARCKDSWYNEGKIQGQIEGLSDEEKYQQGWHDAIEKQVHVDKEEGDRIRRHLIKHFGNKTKKDWNGVLVHSILTWLEKQGEKPQGKSALELWKDMRLEVYQQASGNRHEPNYSDDTTKMFSLNDIDEIMEKITEEQNEQSVNPNPYSGVSFKYKNHTFGMCAREGGVEILIDGELKAFISSEKSFVYPIHPIPNITHKSAVEGGNRYGVNDTPHHYEPAIINQKDFAPKQEPKFKVGDWVVINGLVLKIQEIHNDLYETILQNDELRIYDTYILDKDAHLWAIEDAKEGDVLISEEGYPFIYAGNHIYTKYLIAYCGVTNDGEFKISDKSELWTNDNVEPATKEQRDQLEKAMADAGYTFDFGKKELKEITDSTYCSENCKYDNMLGSCEIEHIEHGKYYYCIKDYYVGGNKRASKGDVVLAKYGMYMMTLGAKANEYFLPVNNIDIVEKA